MFDVTRHITSFRVAEESSLYSLSESALTAAIKTENSLDVHTELSTLGSERIKMIYKKIANIQEAHKGPSPVTDGWQQQQQAAATTKPAGVGVHSAAPATKDGDAPNTLRPGPEPEPEPEVVISTE